MADANDPFMLDIDAWIASVSRRSDKLVQAIAEEALARIKELTPVKTGLLRASWTVVKGQAALGIEGARADDSLAVIAQLHGGDVFAIVNPVVYARRVNYGFVGQDSLGRTYDQKGVHMIEQLQTEMPQIVEKAIARVDSGR